MLNITVVSGGTGSIALQKGLSELLGYENYNLNVIINAYDNGKSTGICRKIFNNKILGPSDLRKNQLTNFECKYSEELKDKQSYYSRLLNLFEIRFDANTKEEYKEKAISYIKEANLKKDVTAKLIFLLDYFFKQEKIEDNYFKDFSISNIFYSSSAALNNYSLEKAGTDMAEILEIKDNVILVSDISLMLKAATVSGFIIEDEGEIVKWNNNQDKITAIKLTDPEHNYSIKPIISERCKDVLKNSDIIILSSGTQWSSLIPTYIHEDFNKTLKETKAKKYLVMNNTEDKDMIGVNADELLKTVSRFIDLSDINIIMNNNAIESMKYTTHKNALYFDLSDKDSKKHNPLLLSSSILSNYFNISKNDTLISDLDGTLYDINNDTISKDNINNFKGFILTGNTEEHIKNIINKYNLTNYKIYCNYGYSFFIKFNSYTGNSSIHSDKDALIKLENKLKEIYKDKVINRKSIITIKPLENREDELIKIKSLPEFDYTLAAVIAGKTSIDIFDSNFRKDNFINTICKENNIINKNVIYIGDEFKNGNDSNIKNSCYKYYAVNDIIESNNFIKVFNFINK